MSFVVLHFMLTAGSGPPTRVASYQQPGAVGRHVLIVHPLNCKRNALQLTVFLVVVVL